MNIAEAVAKRIKELLFKKDMTKYRLTQITCLNEKTIDDIMKGRSKDLKLSTLSLIAFAFKMRLSEFLDDPIFDEENLDI